MQIPFRYFNSSPEVIRLAVMMYIRYPRSLRQVEDILFERGIDICHEPVRFWWTRFGPIFAAEIWPRSIERESFFVVDPEAWVLRLFPEQTIADRQYLDPRAHETAEGILRRADDGFAPHVEAGVDQHRAAGARLERAEQGVIAGVGLPVDGLDARRVIDVGDRRYVQRGNLSLTIPNRDFSSSVMSRRCTLRTSATWSI